MRRSFLLAAFLIAATENNFLYPSCDDFNCDIFGENKCSVDQCKHSVDRITDNDFCEKSFDCEDICKKRQNPCAKMCSKCCYPCGTTIFLPRSQGANTARELVGWQSQLFQPYFLENYATWALTTEYTRSFREEDIARSLFCTDCLTFTGSARKDRDPGQDIVADYFGLPSNFRGSLAVKPRIENVILDFNAFFGLNEFFPGLFLRIHAPLTYTRWNLGLDECFPCGDKFRGSPRFAKCYMQSNVNRKRCNPGNCSAQKPPQFERENNLNPLPDPDNCPCPPGVTGAIGPSPDDLPCYCPPANTIYGPVYTGQFHDFLNCTTDDLRVALSGNFTFGDMSEPWKFGKFSFCPRTKVELADLDIILGIAPIETDYAHLALFGQVVAPTGNRPKGKYIFEPIVGNGHHWELGGGISWHYTFAMDNYINGASAGLWFEGNVTHQFANDQIRSFDFKKNGRLSRYMLLKEYDIADNYTGRMINAINFATRNACVTVDYKVDLSAKLAFTSNFWMVDIGYNFYMKDAEKVCIKTECPCEIDQRRFAIKGITGVCCTPALVEDNILFPDIDVTRADNSDQPKANMFEVIPLKGTNPETLTNNQTVCLSYAADASLTNNATPLRQISKTQLILTNTNKPSIISCKDLDPNSAAQCGFLSHKLFWHIGYMWKDYCYQPHVGLGGEVEFGDKDCSTGLSQWGVWVKGGITF